MPYNTRRGIAPIAVLIIALLVIGGGAYGVKKITDRKKSKTETPAVESSVPVPGTEKKETEVMEKVQTLQITLDEQNGSDQSGQAVITQIEGGKIKVVVSITGKPSSVPQPAHIHVGSCPNPGAVKYPLKAIEKGAAQTELPMTLEQLLSELPLAVNVHKSAAEAKVYTSCGNIEKKETGAMMEKDDAKMQKKGDAMMQEGAKMMEKKGGEMMEDTDSMMQKDTMMQKEAVVTYGSQGFSPKTVSIKKGETVVFQNKTGKPASVASEVHPTHTLYPEFDQWKTAERGKDEFRFTFEKVGTWKYHDHLNSTMTGTVIVTE